MCHVPQHACEGKSVRILPLAHGGQRAGSGSRSLLPPRGSQESSPTCWDISTAPVFRSLCALSYFLIALRGGRRGSLSMNEGRVRRGTQKLHQLGLSLHPALLGR